MTRAGTARDEPGRRSTDPNLKYRAAATSLLIHAAVIAGAWQASWRLRIPAETAIVSARIDPAHANSPLLDPLQPVELAPTPIEPPPEEAVADPAVLEFDLDEPLPATDAGWKPIDSRPPKLHRLRRALPPPPQTPRPLAQPPIAPPVTPPPETRPPPLVEVNDDAIDVTEAATVKAPAPVYPRRAVEQRLEGEVTLLALVRADGSVGGCEVETSSGHVLLDDAAKSALLRWQFKPRLRDGEARPFTARVPFRFTIPR